MPVNNLQQSAPQIDYKSFNELGLCLKRVDNSDLENYQVIVSDITKFLDHFTDSGTPRASSPEHIVDTDVLITTSCGNELRITKVGVLWKFKGRTNPIEHNPYNPNDDKGTGVVIKGTKLGGVREGALMGVIDQSIDGYRSLSGQEGATQPINLQDIGHYVLTIETVSKPRITGSVSSESQSRQSGGN